MRYRYTEAAQWPLCCVEWTGHTANGNVRLHCVVYAYESLQINLHISRASICVENAC